MFAFTKQEQKFLLLFIFIFFIGLTIKYYRQHSVNQQTDAEWKKERSKILEDFQSAAPELKEDVVSEPAITKESLTGRININTASLEELQILPRIGPATARKIIDYRQSQGLFKSPGDLQKIKGIGPKTYAKLENYITVD